MMKSLVHIQSMSHGGNPTFSKLYGFFTFLVGVGWWSLSGIIGVMKRV